MTEKNSEIVGALVKAQLEIKAPFKDKVNPRFKSSYASLDSILEAVRVPLAKHGLVLNHSIECVDGKYVMHSELAHTSGEIIVAKMPMFIGNTDMQGLGSARTYAMRYNVTGLLNLPCDDDDDANESVTKCNQLKPMTKEQIDEIVDLIGEDMELLNRMLKGYGVTRIIEIPSDQYGPIIARLKARKE